MPLSFTFPTMPTGVDLVVEPQLAAHRTGDTSLGACRKGVAQHNHPVLAQ
jgi:hypothetical protein